MPETKLILYDKDLPDIGIWEGLSEARKTRLQELHSDVRRSTGSLIAYTIRIGLDLQMIGEEFPEIGVKQYCKFTYGENKWRDGYRYLEQVEELEKYWPRDFLHEAVFSNIDGFAGFGRIGLRELIPVAREHPAPKARTPERTKKFLEGEVRGAIREGRSTRKKAKKIKFTEDDGKGELFDSIRLNIARAKDEGHIQTSAQVRSYLRDPIGWALEYHAVAGDLTVERKSIPEKFVPRPVGRPSE